MAVKENDPKLNEIESVLIKKFGETLAKGALTWKGCFLLVVPDEWGTEAFTMGLNTLNSVASRKLKENMLEFQAMTWEDVYNRCTSKIPVEDEHIGCFLAQRKQEVTEHLIEYKEIHSGMSFKDIHEARNLLSLYAMVNKKELLLLKSDNNRLRYRCEEGCQFICLISKDKGREGCRVKTLNTKHDCNEKFKNGTVDYLTIAHYFKRKLQDDPKYKCKRAKRMILEKLEGSFNDDYNKLAGYAKALRDSNPGSNVVINLSKEALLQGKRKFLRMYICFQALNMGYKDGLRPFIGLDGTFLKGKAKGQLLVALGQDNQTHFYPLVWAVVDKETKRS
ncbi:uncharacterized protein LOC132637975 [Lycium barbarum]|uniref:uncharacterized protein LOC132637975 n=1 Tax=Lycium barbarum TaxID=112863 RepID=UPI00293E54CB|nr:uncharacterized protein LOC132637975 [Lycium barbarum]